MIVICVGLTAYFLIRFLKRIKTDHSKLRETGQTILAILVIGIIYFTCFFPGLAKTLSLEKNAVEVTGKTIRWIDPADSRNMEYSFVINGELFTGRCEVVYNGQEIPGIKCPGGNYIVLYDHKDPKNSVMDFKRPVK